MPLWFVLFAIGLGLFGLVLLVWSHRPEVHIDDEFAEELRKAQIDAAFRTNGRKVLRADFNRSFK
jgi:hypothetical protein